MLLFKAIFRMRKTQSFAAIIGCCIFDNLYNKSTKILKMKTKTILSLSAFSNSLKVLKSMFSHNGKKKLIKF